MMANEETAMMKGIDISHWQKYLNIAEIKYDFVLLKNMNYEYKQIPVGDLGKIPVYIFTPINHVDVCVIYCHGNSGDLGICLAENYEITKMTNCVIVTFEYPGYTYVENIKAEEEIVYIFSQQVYMFVRDELKYPPSKIVLYGFSMGTGVAFDLACRANFPVAGLIIQAPILSLVRTIYDVKRTFFFDYFNSCDKAKFIHCLTLFIHGNKDRIVPYIHGRILSKLIPEKYRYDFITINGADHNDAFKFVKEEIFEKVRGFIKVVTGVNPDPPSLPGNGSMKFNEFRNIINSLRQCGDKKKFKFSEKPYKLKRERNEIRSEEGE